MHNGILIFDNPMVKEIFAESKDDSMRLRGYACVFYDPDIKGSEYIEYGVSTRFQPGCFNIERDKDVFALADHDFSKVLGRTSASTLKLSTDDNGLYYELTLPNSEAGRNIFESVKRGDITGASVGIIVNEVEFAEDEDNGMEILNYLDVTLKEFSIVANPAIRATTSEVFSEILKQKPHNNRERKRALDLELASQ